MKNYKFVGEGPHHIEVQHADGSRLKIAKAHLDMKMMAKLSQMPKVEKFDEGGGAGDPAALDPSPAPTPQPPGFMNSPLVNGISNVLSGNNNYNKLDPNSQNFVGPPSADAGGAPGPLAADQVPGLSAQNSDPNPPPTPQSAPQQVTPNPAAFNGLNGQIEGIIGQGKQANLDRAAAEGKVSEGIFKAQNDLATSLQQAEVARQQKLSELNAEGQKIQDNITSSKIDPSHYWQDKSTGAKVSMLAGIALGSIGSAMTGQPNTAIQIMQKNIDRDVEAQQANLGTQKTLLEANLKKYGNLEQATQATRLNLISVAQGQVSAAAASQGTPEAMANAKAANAQLEMGAMPSRISLAQWQSGMAQVGGANANASGSGTGSGYDLDKLSRIGFAASKGVGGFSKEDFEAGNKEAGDYSAATTGLQNVLNQYDTMARSKGALMTTAPGFLPNLVRDSSSRNYDSAKSAMAAESARVLGEKPTLSLMAEVEPLFPQAGDKPEDIANHRQQIENLFKKAALDKAGGFVRSKRMGTISPNDPLLHVIQPGPTK